MMKYTLFLLFILLSTNLLANHATISKLRGIVSIQDVDGLNSRNPVLHSKIYVGERITTGRSSVVRLQFDSGSLMTVGPNSQVILTEIREGETKYVSLINGYLRAKFSKEKSDEHKLMISTRSASLGIRGTEFTLIYNQQNDVTTALSLEGNVEFSSVEDEGRLAFDRVNLKEGEFSTTFDRVETVSSPTKISPAQLSALQRNRDLKTRASKGEVLQPDEAEESVVEAKGQQLPAELIGEDHGHTRDNFISDRDTPRPGGYIDLNTGLYIDPPEGARFDEENGVFEVPKAFGGIDPETGEYVPPLGLILHPLKGFVIASTAIETGVHYVREKAGQAAVEVIKGASKIGNKLVQGIEFAGKSFETNTGIVGEQTGKGLRYVGRTAKKVGEKTGELIYKKGLGALNTVAESLNSYLYYGPLKHIGSVFKKIPLVSALDLHFRDQFSYSSKQRDDVYGQTENVVNIPSLHNKLYFSSLYQKTFWKKIFFRPKFNLNKQNYTRTNIPEIKPLNRYRYQMGLDVGAMGKIKGVMVQSYFYTNFSYSSKINNGKNYSRYLRDREFGFSKLIIGSEYISSKFDYTYGEYHLRDLYRGNYHRLALSEIINLDNKNFFNFGINWSTRGRKELNKSVTMYGGKFEYFISHRQHRFKFNTWLDYKLIDDQLYRSSRGLEQKLDFGVKLSKSFPKLFSTSLEYVMSSLFSDIREVNGTGHRLTAAINVSY